MERVPSVTGGTYILGVSQEKHIPTIYVVVHRHYIFQNMFASDSCFLFLAVMKLQPLKVNKTNWHVLMNNFVMI